MVTMGRDDDDARHDVMMMVVMVVMVVMVLGELDLVSRRVGKPCVIRL
jgi:hypothetical protein